ncbi:glycoside hydrolase family 75 protein [Paraburkholderia fungorum]|uniref:Chitosanase of glycosyl hydrolase group 75 n=1 Tax=Paraburkholderia fungorum TaxID=134537 RepID=A0A420FS95_9BURK|nr:glycoside hydrolase family 75 protein [Paraburkholderia fungorum]RKF35781.1 hypothetical protein BCY88_09100 [Paraburkholderia fungorum]
MRIRHSATLIAATLLMCGVAEAGPLEDVTRLIGKANQTPQQPIKFSDGSVNWIDGSSVFRLPAAQAVIVKARNLALDTDGASAEVRSCDPDAQGGTALPDRHGNAIDSNATPYYVLPSCDRGSKNYASCKKNPPYRQLGLQTGDLAAVITGDKIAYAIAGDTGPEKKFGEGSIQLHRRLGHEVIGANPRNPQCAANVSLPQETYLVIFPKSNHKWLPNEEIDRAGAALWNNLLAVDGQ